MTKPTEARRPSIRGTRVAAEFHGCKTPPQVSGIRKVVVEAVKRMAPKVSMRWSLDRSDETGRLRRMYTAVKRVPARMKGKLM